MKRTPTPKREELLHLGSLITYKDGDKERCLGDLMHFEGRGVFDPYFGLVDVTPEEANLHNQALDQARLEGMDKNCEVGQGSFAYYSPGKISTFSGTVISTDISKNGNSITFRRNGKTYRGRERKESENFNFKRIA